MPVNTESFRKHGRGIIAYMRRTDHINGWYFIPINRMVIDDDVIRLKSDWWRDAGTRIDSCNAIFVWKSHEALSDFYGPVDLMIQSDWVSQRLYPAAEFLLLEELIQERMLSGSLHVVVDREIEFDDPSALYLPATLDLWNECRSAWFDDESDGIISVVMKDTSSQLKELLKLITKHNTVPYGRNWCISKNRISLWSELKAASRGSLNIVGAGFGVGKSMVASEYYRQVSLKNTGKLSPLKITTPASMKPHPTPNKMQHRITSVQRRGKSIQRCRRS